MKDKDKKDTGNKASFDYATDSLGWNIPKDTSSILFKLFQEDLEDQKKIIQLKDYVKDD